MPPFMQFRLWLREGPKNERVLAGTAAVIMIAVLSAALAPVAREAQSVDTLGAGAPTGQPVAPGLASPGAVATAAPSAGLAGTTGTVPSGGMPGAVGTTGGTAAPGGPTAQPGGTSVQPTAKRCANRTASAPGLSSTEVLVAMSNISLAGPIGNSTFDLRPDLQDIAKAMAADINERGGLACGRKLVLKQYDVNPIDSNDTQTKCLEMVAAKPFVVLDYGGYVNPAARKCFVNAKLPMETSTSLGKTEVRTGYPYLFGAPGLSEQLIRNGIFGLKKRGFFNAPAFKKLGILEDACDPGVTKALDDALKQNGVQGNQISRFKLSCAVSAPPNQTQQAVLQHKGDNVTHAFMAASVTNNQNYARVAGAQSFRPKYGLSDYGSSLVAPGSGNWHASFDGAVGITTLHTGEFTSGIKNAKLVACDRVLRKHGVPGINSEVKDTSALVYCDLFSFLEQAINNAGDNPTRTSFPQGVSSMGQYRSSLLGDSTFSTAGKLTGGDLQRAIQWRADCTCWKILQPAFARGY